MYHMCIINQQVDGRKSAMPYDYPPHVGSSSWFCDRGQILAHFKNPLKWQSQ